MVDNATTAYCVKCKETRPIKDVEPVFMSNGRAASRGICPVCGTGLFKIGETPAHAGLPRPETSKAGRSPDKEKGTVSASSGQSKVRGQKQSSSPSGAGPMAEPKAGARPHTASTVEDKGARENNAANFASAPLTKPVEAYCIVCKAKRVVKSGRAVFLANGSPAAEGACPKCGTKLFKLGMTADHEGLPKPEVHRRSNGSSARGERSGRASPTARREPGGRSLTQAASKGAVARPKPAGGTGRQAGRGKLVIVESPAKARTVGRFLGSGYDVRASVGHVRDLLRSKLSVDLENDFAPTYRVPNEKRDLVRDLRDAANRAGEIYLATDPDREGEAIAWHLLEAAEMPRERTRRVVFHEITRNAISEAFSHSRDVDMRLVDAQQARRVLDRLVGYQVSPLLWSRVRSRLSAGRVQSVALRLVVEREREIAAFVPVEYWSVDADLSQVTARNRSPRPSFLARLVRVRGAEPELRSESDAQAIVTELEGASYQVANIKRGERRRRPNAPFTTSTLQQDAAQRLGMTAQRTMRVAQELYEGIEIGQEGTVGLITYMRTDSVNIAQEAQAEARGLIAEQFGVEFLPSEPNVFRSRAKNAQEAHEAIRPTASQRTPQAMKQWLNRDQYRLYELIWQRFVASQMAAAIYDTLAVEVSAGSVGQPTPDWPYLFRTSGSKVRFPGFLVVYSGGASGPAGMDGADGMDAQPVANGNGSGNGEEETGERADGRGDGRAYLAGREVPSDLVEGEPLDLLKLLPEQHFTQPPPRYSEATLVKALEENGIGRPSTYATILSTIVDRGYVERADKRLIPTELGFTVNDLLIKYFDTVFDVGFTANLEEHLDGIASGDEQWVPVLRDFYSYFEPKLREAEQSMEKVQVEPEKTGESCPECGSDLVIKLGRFGKFVACSNYPNCRYTKPLVSKIGVACPVDGGELVERRTKRGRVFYGCSNFPACDYKQWKRPLPQPCPHCGGLLVQANKDWAECTACQKRVRLDQLETGERELEGAKATV